MSKYSTCYFSLSENSNLGKKKKASLHLPLHNVENLSTMPDHRVVCLFFLLPIYKYGNRFKCHHFTIGAILVDS